jgi:Kef-type K+ transport system membrane component KefB
MGLVFRRLGQTAVIGEMFAGILLGPSLLGQLFPQASLPPLY